MAKLTAEQIAAHEAKVVFRQQIKYVRSRGFCGDMYVGSKPVDRAIMVIKSDQESSVMVQKGFPFVTFITANSNFYADETPQSHFFATAEEAVQFCRDRIAADGYVLRGEATGTHA